MDLVDKPNDDVEESTKVHSADQLDEVLQRARAEANDHGEHTRIAPAEELARALNEPLEPAVSRVANPNVMRRTSGLHIIPRSSDEISSVVGSGVMDIESTPAPPDDAAEAGASDDAQRPAAKTPQQIERIPAEAIPPLAERSVVVGEAPGRSSVPSIPPINVARLSRPTPTPMPMPIFEPAPAWPMRWVIACATLLAIAIGVGAFAYIKIHRLERELATTKHALERAHGKP